jgi:hypothetical protein
VTKAAEVITASPENIDISMFSYVQVLWFLASTLISIASVKHTKKHGGLEYIYQWAVWYSFPLWFVACLLTAFYRNIYLEEPLRDFWRFVGRSLFPKK